MSGWRIQQAREVRGLCLHDLAEMLGVFPEHIAAWEAQKVVVMREALASRLRSAVQLPVGFFYFKNNPDEDVLAFSRATSSLDWHCEVDPLEPCCDACTWTPDL